MTLCAATYDDALLNMSGYGAWTVADREKRGRTHYGGDGGEA